MRINKYLASCGFGSRRKVEALVTSGAVFVNKKQMKDLAYQVQEDDEILVGGQKAQVSDLKYFAVNKPVGYVSTVDDKFADKKVVDLVDIQGLYPVGRLDKESEGLMILTNDGDFAQKMMHPSHEHEKEYLVEVAVSYQNHSAKLENALQYFKCGIKIGEKRSRPAQISLLGVEKGIAKFKIILKEGIKRQIRITFEKAGLHVLKLQRVRMGKLKLGELESGDFIELTKMCL